MSAKEGQNATFYSGDTRSLRLPIADKNGAPAVMSAPVVYYKAAPSSGSPTPTIAKHSPSDGARMVQETISGVLWWVAYVDFAEADTKDITGTYIHQLRIVDGVVKVMTAQGVLKIKPRIGVL